MGHIHGTVWRLKIPYSIDVQGTDRSVIAEGMTGFLPAADKAMVHCQPALSPVHITETARHD